MNTKAFQYGDVVSIATYPGIAFYVGGQTVDTCYDEDADDTYDQPRDGFYDCIMVGDDRVHVVDVDDMRHIDEKEFCSVCGQIGCTHDYRIMERVSY